MATIVIVDDEEEILEPLEQMLSSEGYRTKAFSSSIKAETYLLEHRADLAIFDIKMPELDGFSLLKSVRSNSPDLPIIFSIIKSRRAGSDHWLHFRRRRLCHQTVQ